jgi:Holliday junction DNA helicase RuvA
MIAHLTGEVIEWQENRLVVDVGGVGYETFSPLSSTAQVRQGDTVSLHVHTLVREDAFILYGFASRAERDMFLLLIGVSQVGPKVALAALSTLPLADLSSAIQREDITQISKIPGVGKKTASRMALELRDKVIGIAVPAAQMAQGAVLPVSRGPMHDAVSALVNLGYSKAKAESAIAALGADADTPVEVLIRQALGALSQPS